MSTALYNGFGELKWEKQTNTTTQGEITTDYTYDDNTGQLLTRVRNGETTGYGYDALKRLSTVEISGQHKLSYTYGDYDRVSTLTELIGTRSFGKQLAYDSYGRVTTTTFPSGYYTLNHYDTYGNLTEVTDQSSRSIWKATQANARGNITTEMKGSKETVYGYDEPKAQLTSMTTSGVVNYSFGYDTKNNLSYRSDNLINQKEQYTYDTQNRLTNWDVDDATNEQLKTSSISYDVMGNIATKSDLNIPDAVTLKYEEPAHPHALSSISGNPDAISKDNLSVIYTGFCKIKMLNEGMTKHYSITYGVDDQRRRTVYTSNDTTQTRYYLGDYEEESDNNGNVKKIHYLSGGAMLVQNNGAEKLYYGYTDNQGSLIALTDKDGNVVEKYAYDPWGGRRNPDDWQLKDTRSSFITNRGYTGHEHIDAFNIINMNGRVYDPVTAMFFSPDPFIQSPENWMNYNRYSYVMNNPTRSTDPTGYYMAELKEERFESSGFDEVNAGGSDPRGGGGGLGSDPFGYSANNNYYNNGIYFGSNSNTHQYFIGLSFYNDKLGLTQWYTKNGFAELEQIMNDYSSGSNNASGQGGMPGWASDVNTGINAFGVANNAKTELIDYAVRSNYKSARTWSEFNNLRSSQQAWRTTNTLGKTGANYLKYAKGLGYVGAGLTTTYSAANAGMYYYNGGTDWQVGTKATLDVIMTGVGFLGPIGFGISASYFILDATTGGFGGFGQIKP